MTGPDRSTRLTVMVVAYPADPHFIVQVGSLAATLTEDETRHLRHEIDVWLSSRQRTRGFRYWRALVHRSAGWINPHRRNP